MRRLNLIVPVILALFLSACATQQGGVGGLTVETAVNGQPVAGANCTVMSGGNSWQFQTPVTLPGVAPGRDLRVVCDLPGYRTSELILPAGATGSSGGGWASSIGVGVGSGWHGRGTSLGLGLSFPLSALSSSSQGPGRIVMQMTPQ